MNMIWIVVSLVLIGIAGIASFTYVDYLEKHQMSTDATVLEPEDMVSDDLVDTGVTSIKSDKVPKWSDQRIIQNVIDHCNTVGERTDILLSFKNQTHSIDNIGCKWQIDSVLVDILDRCKQITETGSFSGFAYGRDWNNGTHYIDNKDCKWGVMKTQEKGIPLDLAIHPGMDNNDLLKQKQLQGVLDHCERQALGLPVNYPYLQYENETHIITNDTCEWRKMHLRDNAGD